MGSGNSEHRPRLALLGGLALVLAAGEARAFCRTTTCDPKTEDCPERDKGCILSGAKLAWPDRCVSFGTHKDGSPRRRISYAAADRVFRGAFTAWASADCGGGQRPSFQVWDLGDQYGGIECAEPEFNKSSPNANVWLFRDDDWPYDHDDATLAMTTVQFEKSSGVILDADVEINSYGAKLTVSGQPEQDLASIATHEAGHFLGLSHTPIEQATMFARYVAQTTGIRTLHADDVRGICEAYPPDRETIPCDRPRPPGGFSRFCGNETEDEGPQQFRACAVSKAGGSSPGSREGFVLAFAALGVLVRRSRRFLARQSRSR